LCSNTLLRMLDALDHAFADFALDLYAAELPDLPVAFQLDVVALVSRIVFIRWIADFLPHLVIELALQLCRIRWRACALLYARTQCLVLGSQLGLSFAIPLQAALVAFFLLFVATIFVSLLVF